MKDTISSGLRFPWRIFKKKNSYGAKQKSEKMVSDKQSIKGPNLLSLSKEGAGGDEAAAGC